MMEVLRDKFGEKLSYIVGEYDRKKHWSLKRGSMSFMINFTDSELAKLEMLKNNVINKEERKTIDKIIEKIRVLNPAKNHKTDIDILLESQGYAVRQYAKENLKQIIMEQIALAILSQGLSKQRSIEFVEKMQRKKYILNEIPSINTNFVYDQTDINYLGISCKSLIYTSIDSNVESNVNAYIFAYVLELNIMKILDNQIMNFNDCKNEFEWFLNVQYKDIDNLKDKIKEFCHNFCFDDLYDETKVNELFDDDAESKERYVELGKTTTSGKIDGDDTKLARIVMFLLHRDDGNNEYAIPGLKSFSDMGSGYKYKYRGDTLNTYSTLLGSNNQGYEKFFLNFGMSDSRIAQFRRQYVTMGNFMLLHANTINRDSINTFRGTAGKYRDFFDLFMDGFINGHDFDKWKDLPETEEYFKVMNDLSSFIKINFLEDYFDMDAQAVKKNLFAHPNPNAPYHWCFTEIDQAETYRSFAINYIQKAMLIIKNRADKMSERLQNIYLK